jgi:4-hydroxy-4-methyl-2-oxoglutarate aldolase
LCARSEGSYNNLLLSLSGVLLYMYIVNPAPDQISPELIAGLLESDTGSVGHFVDAGVMDPRIAAKMPGAKIAGTAITVRVTVPDSVIGHYALKFARPGYVLVVERGQDRKTACFGGTSSLSAAIAGLSGLIIDGAGNDIAEASEAGLAIWCDGVTPLTTKYRNLGGAVNVPISCGGVSVSPGDVIFADDNGVLVIPPSQLNQVVEEARAFKEREQEFRARIRANPHINFPELTGGLSIVESNLTEKGLGPG